MDQFDINFIEFITNRRGAGKYDNGTYLINEGKVVFLTREGENIIRREYEFNGNLTTRLLFINNFLVDEVNQDDEGNNLIREYSPEYGLIKLTIGTYGNGKKEIFEAKDKLIRARKGEDNFYNYYILFDRDGKVNVDLTNLVPPELHGKMENVSVFYYNFPREVVYQDNRYTIIIKKARGYRRYAEKIVVYDHRKEIMNVNLSKEGRTKFQINFEMIPDIKRDLLSSVDFGYLESGNNTSKLVSIVKDENYDDEDPTGFNSDYDQPEFLQEEIDEMSDSELEYYGISRDPEERRYDHTRKMRSKTRPWVKTGIIDWN